MQKTKAVRPSGLALSSYGSPLRKPVIGWGLAVALAILILYSLGQLAPFFDLSQPQMLGVLLMALAVTGLISVIPVMVLRWLDRREPEPWFMYALCFAWGALIATAISSDINSDMNKVLGPFLEAALVAPWVEEGAKALGLLVFLFLLRDEFDGPRDGFIYGALIGLGFIWLETSVYIARGFQESGTVAWAFQLGSRYVLAGLDGHAIYTGITGTFIGFALIQKSWWRRLTLPLAGYLLAVLSHMAWNSLGVIVSGVTASMLGMMVMPPDIAAALQEDPMGAPFWLSWVSNLIALIISNGIAYLIIISGLRRSDRWERAVMADHLRDEVGTSTVSTQEFAQIEQTAEPPKEPPAREIFSSQCNLAKRKFRLNLHNQPVDADPVVQAWRDELGHLRQMAQARLQPTQM